MPKRKSSHSDETAQDVAPRRSTRQRTSTLAAKEGSTSSITPRAVAKGGSKPVNSKSVAAKTKTVKVPKQDEDEDDDGNSTALKTETDGDKPSEKETPAKSKTSGDSDKKESTSVSASGRQYWLLKAEPESRFENGIDVKFSIDDLAAKTEPEPWDGMLYGPFYVWGDPTMKKLIKLLTVML